MAKITKRLVNTLKAPTDSKFLIVWDDELKGFGIRIMQSGTKTYIADYRNKNGRQRRISVGRHGKITPKEAREEARKILGNAKDTDPLDERQAERSAVTFGFLAEEYIKRRCSEKKSGHEDERIIRKDLLKPLGRIPARDLSRREIKKLAANIKERGSPIMANRTLSVIKRIFNFGIEWELVEMNPALLVKPVVKETGRDRVLDEKEIKKLWKELDKLPGSQSLRAAMRLILVTAQRPGEVIGAEWSEIDLDSGLWTIPKEKHKNDQAHNIPLSPIALQILQELGPKEAGYVFPSPKLPGQSFTTASMDRLLNRYRGLFSIDRFTPHDLRRTARSQMAAIGISPFIAERVLGHKYRGVAAVYDRYGYDREKREALDAWAVKLESIITGKKANVVPIKR